MEEGDFDLENELMDEESYYNEIRGGYPEEEQEQEGLSSLYGAEEAAAMGNYVEELLQLERESEMKRRGRERGEEVTQRNDSNGNPFPAAPIRAVAAPVIKPWDEPMKKPSGVVGGMTGGGTTSSSSSSLFSSSGRAGVGGAGGGYITQLPSFISATAEAKKYLKDRPSLGDDCQSVTLPNGKRKYIYHRRDGEAPPLKSVISERDSLLSKPIEEILREAERKKIASLAAHEENNLNGSRELFSGETSSSSITNPLSYARQQLWVDKYAPKSFSQVLYQSPSYLPTFLLSLFF